MSEVRYKIKIWSTLDGHVEQEKTDATQEELDKFREWYKDTTLYGIEAKEVLNDD